MSEAIFTQEQVNALLRKLEADLLESRKKAQTACRLCGHKTKIQKRKLNGGQVKTAIELYRFSKTHADENGWFMLGKDSCGKAGHLDMHHGEYEKLPYFGILEAGECLGQWRFTEVGKLFMEGKASVPKHIFTQGTTKTLVGIGTEKVTIHEALGTPFNLMELLQPIEEEIL